MIGPDRAEAFVLAWARIYTRGLDDDSRRSRIEELRSDCHEQRRWGDEVGASPTAVAISMATRTLAGMPADLLWRQGRLATSRDRSPEPRGRPMGGWIRDNWWLVIAGALGVMLTVLGIGLPFEDRSLGSVFGGIVIAALGIGMLVGIRLRRRNRRLGALLIAVGTLPTFPFFWTVVLPLLGLAVFIPALLDAADAAATGDVSAPAGRPAEPTDAPPAPWRRDRVLLAALALLGAAVVAAVVVGTQTAAAALCAPPLALLIAHVALRRLRMPTRLARVGLTAFATGLAHAALLAVAVLGGDGSVDLSTPIAVVLGGFMGAIGGIGLLVWVVAMVIARDRARPA